MSFQCFKCNKKFDDIKYIILHLKLTHFIKNDTVPMKCLVNGNLCREEFFCFNKLKTHVKSCRPNSSTNIKSNPEFRQTILEKSFEDVHITACVSKHNSSITKFG